MIRAKLMIGFYKHLPHYKSTEREIILNNGLNFKFFLRILLSNSVQKKKGIWVPFFKVA